MSLFIFALLMEVCSAIGSFSTYDKTAHRFRSCIVNINGEAAMDANCLFLVYDFDKLHYQKH